MLPIYDKYPDNVNQGSRDAQDEGSVTTNTHAHAVLYTLGYQFPNTNMKQNWYS